MIKIGIVKGLGKIKDFNAEVQRKRDERDNKTKTDWFSLSEGESVKVRFLQELDEDSPNYSAKNDLGFLALEHTGPGPEGWKRRAQCTEDTGECYPCEQRRINYQDWKKPQPRLYINVLLNPDSDDEQVVVLAQGTSAKSITPNLIEYAGETGSITDRVFKITRNGKGTDTSYGLVAFDKKEFEKSVEDYELVDLTAAAKVVPYEEQAAFFGAAPTSDGDSEKSETGDKAASFVSW